MIGEGVYDAVVKETDWTTSSKGTFGLKVNVAVLENQKEECEMEGRIWFSKSSMKMARAQLKAIGFEPDTQEMMDIGSDISLVGKPCKVTLKNEEWKGNWNLRIAYFGVWGEKPKKKDIENIQEAIRAESSNESKDEDEDQIPF